MDYQEHMRRCKKRIEEMRRAERSAGFASDEEMGPAVLLRTVMMAIETAIAAEDWDCVGEAQVMLATAGEQLGFLVPGDSVLDKIRNA